VALKTPTRSATEDTQQQPEQLLYARWLQWGTRCGQCLLWLTFALYLLGWPSPHLAPKLLPHYWGLPVKDFLQATGSPAGWGWLEMLVHSDMAGLLGIAFLALCCLWPLLALIPQYWRRRDFAFVALCAAQILVLLLAASGLLVSSH
jgi:hypothetical protein